MSEISYTPASFSYTGNIEMVKKDSSISWHSCSRSENS